MRVFIGLLVFVAVAIPALLAGLALLGGPSGGRNDDRVLRKQRAVWFRRPPATADNGWDRRIGRYRVFIEQAGMVWLAGWMLTSVGVVATIAGACAIGLDALFLSGAGGGRGVLGLWLVLVAFSAIGCWAWVAIQRGRRLRRIEEQLPPALTVMSMAMRTGQPILSAIRVATTGSRHPLRGELERVVAASQHGAELRHALLALSERCPSEEMRFFVLAMTIQSESGANPARVLEGLSATIRARALQRRRTRALVAEGEMSAWMMTALPVVVLIVRFGMDPTYYTSKFGDPIFWPAVVILMLMLGLAWAIIYRITHFKY